MTGDQATPNDDVQQGRVKRLFRWHRHAFVAVMAALIAANIAIGGGWWSFWPMCAWGLVFSLHFLYYKSVTIDEAWAEEAMLMDRYGLSGSGISSGSRSLVSTVMRALA